MISTMDYFGMAAMSSVFMFQPAASSSIPPHMRTADWLKAGILPWNPIRRFRRWTPSQRHLSSPGWQRSGLFSKK